MKNLAENNLEKLDLALMRKQNSRCSLEELQKKEAIILQLYKDQQKITAELIADTNRSVATARRYLRKRLKIDAAIQLRKEKIAAEKYG